MTLPTDAVTTIVLVDDQALVREGLRIILDAEPDLQVVGEAPDGVAARQMVSELAPDVVLMDVEMPGEDGLTATRSLVESGVRSRILMLTTFDLDEYVYQALAAGASGFLLKDMSGDQLVAAVRDVATGADALLAPAVTRRLVERFAGRPTRPVSARKELERLTERETEVLRLVAQGLNNAEIAARLYIGETTVKTHVARMLSKIGARDRVQAVIFAYESGLLDG